VGGLTLSGNYQTAIGLGGYCYSFSDASTPCTACGMSSACTSSMSLCGAGTAAAVSTTNWGSGFGCELNQVQSTTANPNPTAGTTVLSGSGITYGLSSVPANTVYLIVDSSGTDYYCRVLTATGTCLWSQFNSAPWSTTGVALGTAPTASHVQVEVASGTLSESWSFCLTKLALAP
jgi:hypothetical protein